MCARVLKSYVILASESRHVWMSRVTYECVTNHCWSRSSSSDLFSRGPYEWFMSRMNQSREIRTRHTWHDSVRDTCHGWFKCATRELIHELLIHWSHQIRTSHEALLEAVVRRQVILAWHLASSYVTYEWVMSHVNESRTSILAYYTHVAHDTQSYHVWMIHVTYELAMSRVHVSPSIRWGVYD